MANLTKSYETVFVLSNKLTEEATAELVKKFTDLIAANGTIDSIARFPRAPSCFTLLHPIYNPIKR